MNILIIEPDIILAEAYKKAFEAAGVAVKLCADAQSAIIAIDEQLPKAVILEIQLAGHSGIEFLQEFRSYEDWSDIPVYIHSNVPEYVVNNNPNTWKTYGVKRYFYKPQTSMQQLIGTVKGALSE